ncbi:MAG: ATP-binding cassette domain-containing protein [Chitinophagaceae bacterium]|nr:ATP-binding cassette domain-containing protein [Oligoflexus sp.]
MVKEQKDVLLTVRNLETRFGTRTIHHGLDLDVYKGELLVLFGGSGTGKSTLLRAIIGLDQAASGSIRLGDQELLELDDKGWRDVRRQIGYSFQSGALFDSLTVGENLEYPLREFTHQNASERKAAATAMLKRVGLPGIEDLYPSQLSGGMQKRVGMARTLMLDPALILYDEPTAGLDPANSKMIAELMRELKQSGKTGILVTHDVPCALSVGDRIAYLHAGKISVVQTREDIDKSPDEHISAYMNGEIE